MTSAHSMFTRLLRLRRRRVRRRIIALVMAALGSMALAACDTGEKLQSPAHLHSPYLQQQVWAIVPFANESGVSIVNPERIADLFAAQAEDIQGIATIPVNRVIFAMRKLHMRSITTPNDAMSLMNVLGVDGLIVGTITAWDPYSPPKLGAAVQLFRRERTEATPTLDPQEIVRARSEPMAPGAMATNEPAAQASVMFDASNHRTLMQLENYATGRAEPDSAYGKRIYLVNMELYTQFVAYRLLHDLLAFEWARLQPVDDPD